MNLTNSSPIQEQIAGLNDDARLPYQVCASLAGEIQQLLSRNDYNNAGTCLRGVEDAYASAHTQRLKMAIENDFLYRLGQYISCSQERGRLLRMMPQTLREKMIEQAIASGI